MSAAREVTMNSSDAPGPLPPPDGPERPMILVRVYPGYHEAALEAAQWDAETLTAQGYYPVAQSYATGRWSGRWVAGSMLLSLVVIGIPLLVYMLLVDPPGSLAVTYELRHL
jgi:hypothetical protein